MKYLSDWYGFIWEEADDKFLTDGPSCSLLDFRTFLKLQMHVCPRNSAKMNTKRKGALLHAMQRWYIGE